MSLKIFGQHRLNDRQVARHKRRVLFLRDPVERMGSAYRFFKKMSLSHHQGANYKTFDVPAMTDYPAFVDMTFERPDDTHWLAQVTKCRSYTEVRRWEELPQFILETTGKVLPHENASHPYDADLAYRLDELCTRYAEDYALLQDAMSTRRRAASRLSGA